MAKVENIEALQATLRSRAKRAQEIGDISVTVSYTQNYAVYVHENLEVRHPVGQAKFLEEPARTLGPELGKMIGAALAKGVDPQKAFLLAGLRLQRESQKLCPVDTGALRASATTTLSVGGKAAEGGGEGEE